MRVEHDANRLPGVCAPLAGGQLRVVLDDSVDADQDRVVHVAQAMCVMPRGLAGDPARLAGGRRDLAVERHRVLRGYERLPRSPVPGVELVQAVGLRREDANGHLDAGSLQPGDARTADPRVGIDRRRDHGAGDARGQDGVSARWRAVRVGARLEVRVDGPAERLGAGCSQGFLLGVRLALAAVESLAGELSGGVEHDCPDHRVGAGAIVGHARQFEGARHPPRVVAGIAGIQRFRQCINNRIRSMRVSSLLSALDPNFMSPQKLKSEL